MIRVINYSYANIITILAYFSKQKNKNTIYLISIELKYKMLNLSLCTQLLLE